MNARAHTVERGFGRRTADRLAATFVLLLLGVGSLFLWIGVPATSLWLIGNFTESSSSHFVIGLLLVPVAMAAFSPVLFWLNGLYLRITGTWDEGDDEDEDPRWQQRGPLEPFLYLGMAAALVSLFVWFFFFAENPPELVW